MLRSGWLRVLYIFLRYNRAPLAARPELHYTVSMDAPGTHYFRVVLKLRGFSEAIRKGDTLRLRMPVWTPGSYLVREFARNVLDVVARRADGRQLRVEKDSKNSWSVSLDGAGEVVVVYSVYAFVHTPQSSYLDSKHAIINGASVFLFVEGLVQNELTVTVVPPDGWYKVSTGLEPIDPGNPWELHAQNYDVLVDSPIEVGNQETNSFQVSGIRHDVSIFSPVPVSQPKQDALVADLKRIVETEVPIFGEIPTNATCS